MSDERTPTDDLQEGLRLILRAARTAAQQVDVSKVDKSLDKVISHATRVATTVGRFVTEEVERISGKAPPWASRGKCDCSANAANADNVGGVDNVGNAANNGGSKTEGENSGRAPGNETSETQDPPSAGDQPAESSDSKQ